MQIGLDRGTRDGNRKAIEKCEGGEQAEKRENPVALLQALALSSCGSLSALRALSTASSGLESTGACTTSAARVVNTRAMEACASTMRSTPFKSSTSAFASRRSWVAEMCIRDRFDSLRRKRRCP